MPVKAHVTFAVVNDRQQAETPKSVGKDDSSIVHSVDGIALWCVNKQAGPSEFPGISPVAEPVSDFSGYGQ